MSMGNINCVGVEGVDVMATANHPTTTPDDVEPTREGTAERSERPGVGLAHVTVVPTNFERDD
jgi:hypothetical protein